MCYNTKKYDNIQKMRFIMAYKELRKRGTTDFPIAFETLNTEHPRYNMSAHWHQEIELIRILEGEFPILLNNNLYNLKKGDCVL